MEKGGNKNEKEVHANGLDNGEKAKENEQKKREE